jgi:hypothetical protein
MHRRHVFFSHEPSWQLTESPVVPDTAKLHESLEGQRNMENLIFGNVDKRMS